MNVSAVIHSQSNTAASAAMNNELLRVLIKLGDGDYRVEQVGNVEDAMRRCRQLGGLQWQLIGRYTPL